MSWLPEEAREMLDALVAFMKRLGRDPTFMEAKAEPSLPEPNDYAYYFGSFTEAVKDAHRKAFVCKEQPKIAKTTSVIRIFTEEEEELMSRRAITDEEYVVSALRLQKELGHFPNISELRKDSRAPSPQSYERRFGGDWNTVRACIRKKATELGISEDNFETIIKEHPELFAPKKEKAKPAPEPNSFADIPVPEGTKYNPEASDSDGEGVADGILGPEEDLAAESEAIPKAVPEPELEPESEAEVLKPVQVSIPILSELVAEPVLPSEVEPEGNKLISLLPQTKILSPKVEGYATVFVTKGLVPLQKTVVGVPVSQNYCGLNMVLKGRTISFPEPSEGVFYIVERKIASIAKASGRETYDLLIPEKFDREENDMTITEFSIL